MTFFSSILNLVILRQVWRSGNESFTIDRYHKTMPIETEKKYRIAVEQAVELAALLEARGGVFQYERFEENLLYRGGQLDVNNAVLRIRKTGSGSFLTYKEKANAEDGFKARLEYETQIADPAAAEAMIGRLGYRLSLVYEKRRKAWRFANCEVVIDELPFGVFVEIEGAPDDIQIAEQRSGVDELEVEPNSYPSLTVKYGREVEGVIEARFK